MKAFSVSSVIDNPEAIAFLCDFNQHRYLEPFFENQNVARAALKLREPLHVVYRQVKRMVRLGLMHESGTIRRAGRPIRLYRVNAERFFIPFTHRSIEEVMTDLNRSRQTQFMTGLAASWLGFSEHNQGWGTTFYRSEHGQVTGQAPTTLESTISPPPLTPTAMRWQELRLSTADARDLMDQVFAVLESFEARASPKHRTYLLGFNIVAVTQD